MILSRLREVTSEQHRLIEQTIDLPSRLKTLESYAAYLARFYGFYLPVESRLAQVSSLASVVMNFSTRLKTSLLKADLIALGWTGNSIEAIDVCSSIPEIEDLPSALGTLYVLEGSTLGGQYVRKQIQNRYQLGPDNGCSFFSCYGHQVREMWTDFCGAMTAFSQQHSESDSKIISAAMQTFTRFEAWVANERNDTD